MDVAAESRAKRRVTWLGAGVNLILTGTKLAAGILGRSAAMVSDSVHSFSDLVSDAVVLLGIRLSDRPADEGHPFGHGRFETLAAFILGLILIGAGVLLGWEGLEKIRHPEPAVPTWLAAGAALLSIVVKEALFRWTRAVARSTGSKAVEANAWHHRSDALSSLVALAAIIGAILLPRWNFLDPVGSIIVALMIAGVGFKVILDAARELTDSGVERELRERMGELTAGVRGVGDVRRICARHMGNLTVVDLVVAVDPEMDVFQAHRITEHIEANLHKHLPRVGRVFVHVEPLTEPELLDGRRNAEIRRAVEESCRSIPGLVGFHDLRLHRRATGVALDIHVELDGGLPLADAHRVADEVRLCLEGLEGVDEVLVHLDSERDED
ncbi:MAG TPA: cation-efflux pump [bacterium]|nr:cation-efflux pump [bacterium]